MATRKCIVVLGSTLAHPVGDKAGWLAEHAWADLDSVGDYNVGSYPNLFTMPAAFPLQQTARQQGVAIPGIRYLVFYNPISTGWQFYPSKGKFVAYVSSGSTDDETWSVQPFWTDTDHEAGTVPPLVALDTTATRDRTGVSYIIGTNTITTMRFDRATPVPTPPPPVPHVPPLLFDPPVLPGEQFTYDVRCWQNSSDGTYVDVATDFLEFVAGGPIGDLAGCILRCTAGANAGVSRLIERVWWVDVSGVSKPGRIILSAVIAGVANTGPFPSTPQANDKFAIEPQHANVPFERWGYWLPWSPYEGKDNAFVQKANPYPPGFNYPSHISLPLVYDVGAGPRLIEDLATWHPGLAMRIKQRIGEDVYVLALGIPESTLAPREAPESPAPAWLDDTCGWFDRYGHLSWSPAMLNGLFKRLEDSITAAKYAAALEGDTLQVIGVFSSLCESESKVGGGVETCEINLRTLCAKVRGLLETQGLVADGDRVPWVQGEVPPFVASASELNTAIKNVMQGDPYSATFTFADAAADATTDFYGAVNGASMTLYEQRCFDAWVAMQVLEVASVSTPVATAVSICNLALSHLGDGARVLAIEPPDGSAQAAHCARFYPIARNALLEEFVWTFTLKRARGQLVKTFDELGPHSSWHYGYAYPVDAAGLLYVLPEGAFTDFGPQLPAVITPEFFERRGLGLYTPQPYVVETLGDAKVILTNEPNAVFRYRALVADTAQFSAQFVVALSWRLAAMLAGPLLKGAPGSAKARECLQIAAYHVGMAAVIDSHEQQDTPEHQVSWLESR